MLLNNLNFKRLSDCSNKNGLDGEDKRNKLKLLNAHKMLIALKVVCQKGMRNSPVAQGLRSHASNAGGEGSILGQGAKIPHATQ